MTTTDHSPNYDHYQRGLGTPLSPLWRDLARADSRASPATLLQESSPNLGSARIPPARYTSAEYHRSEVEKIWKKTWQVVCRAEEIPGIGDHFVYDVAGLSFIVVRVGADSFRAYHNVCLHRGRKLVDGCGKGAQHFRCAYHAWTWSIEGELAYYPGAWDFPDVTAAKYGLRAAQCDTWGGFIFINPDLQAPGLAQHLGSLPEHFASWPLDDRFTLWHVQKRIKANWKVGIEAFLEGYHLMATHPQALPSVGEQASQYDVWDEGDAFFSRSITPTGIPSYHAKNGSQREAIAEVWALLNGLRMDEACSLPDTITDRQSLAQWRREALGEMTGTDYSGLSDALMLDSVQYWLFPNFCPWFGEGLPLIYQFRPDQGAPDSCFMDVWMLIHKPASGAVPAAPPLIKLGPDEKFETHIGAMGTIFDQDDFNMPKVQEGLTAWPGDPEGCTLSRYQEIRIRFLHQILERKLAR